MAKWLLEPGRSVRLDSSITTTSAQRFGPHLWKSLCTTRLKKFDERTPHRAILQPPCAHMPLHTTLPYTTAAWLLWRGSDTLITSLASPSSLIVSFNWIISNLQISFVRHAQILFEQSIIRPIPKHSCALSSTPWKECYCNIFVQTKHFQLIDETDPVKNGTDLEQHWQLKTSCWEFSSRCSSPHTTNVELS